MLYKQTTWEYKNLGTGSCEIVLDKRDSFDDFARLESSITEDYRVLKLPTCMPEFLYMLPSLGYVFEENQILLTMAKNEFHTISIKNEHYKRIQFEEISTPDKLEELRFLRDGETFLTDRIALDPKFGPKIAGIRYFNWMNDICKTGGSVVLAKIDGRIIACSTVEMRKNGVCHLALGGMMATPEDEAYYACMDIAERYAFDTLKAKRLETAVSSNNLPVLRLHEKKGYHIKSLQYVYIKHVS